MPSAAAIDTRKCAFCGGHAPVMEDRATQKLYECHKCFSVEVITKGRKREDGAIYPGWYHGWFHPDGRSINADGKREKPDNFGWWDRHR